MTVSSVNIQGKYLCRRDSYIISHITRLFSWALYNKYQIHLHNTWFSGLKKLCVGVYLSKYTCDLYHNRFSF